MHLNADSVAPLSSEVSKLLVNLEEGVEAGKASGVAQFRHHLRAQTLLAR